MNLKNSRNKPKKMFRPFYTFTPQELEDVRRQADIIETTRSHNPPSDRKLVKEEGDFFIFECPHCDGTVIVNRSETACCIFRHAVHNSNFQQINPHTPKEECDRLRETNQVHGCAKPFRFVYSKPQNYVEKCDYI